MPLSNKELDLLADEQYKGRRITNSIYCSECGYNLKTLPYKYQCPECGHTYNARPSVMHGIYLFRQHRFPLFDIAATILSLVGFLISFSVAFNPLNITALSLAVFFDVMMLIFGFRAYHRIKRYFRYRSIARHIAYEEDASQGA